MIERKDVRIQVFITPSQDDKLTDLAQIMGMSKNEIIRYAIGSLSAGYETGVRMLREQVSKEGFEDESSSVSQGKKSSN